MAKIVLGVWAAIVIAVAACSGSATNGNFGDAGGGLGSVTAEQACTDMANTVCTALQSCLPLYTQLLYGDMTTCAARTKVTCPSTLGASGTGLTPAGVEACASAIGATSCTDLFAGNTPSACVTHGSLIQGAACADNAQCAGANSYCNVAPGQTCGVCGTLAAAGGSCILKRDCGPGLECGKGTGALQTSAGTCVAAGAAGATCDA
ncbi:MAG: hypothetical protein M3O46_03550, partial [Myxococcota bacterium]|nr:hypothetical protein [Myxococcota bacterium]